MFPFSLSLLPSSALGHHVTPLPMPNPLVSTQYLQFSPKAVQNIRISWLSWHMNTSNDSFFIHCYTKTEIISSMHSLTNQYTENQLVKRSHNVVVPYSSLVIFMFSKQFFSCRFLSCSIQWSALNTHTGLSNRSPWSSNGLTTHCAYSPCYGTQSNAPKPSASDP